MRITCPSSGAPRPAIAKSGIEGRNAIDCLSFTQKTYSLLARRRRAFASLFRRVISASVAQAPSMASAHDGGHAGRGRRRKNSCVQSNISRIMSSATPTIIILFSPFTSRAIRILLMLETRHDGRRRKCVASRGAMNINQIIESQGGFVRRHICAASYRIFDQRRWYQNQLAMIRRFTAFGHVTSSADDFSRRWPAHRHRAPTRAMCRIRFHQFLSTEPIMPSRCLPEMRSSTSCLHKYRQRIDAFAPRRRRFWTSKLRHADSRRRHL